MTEKALRFLRDKRLLAQNDSVLLAVSGGADSVALLLFFIQRLMRPYRLNLAVAHFNHGLRGKASDADARFVEKLARKHGLPFYHAKTRVKPARGESPEEACRRYRYAFLKSTATTNGYGKIATAHHADDQAETLLMRILTGTGLTGLAGIRAKNGRCIRPLLCVAREEILGFLKKQKQAFRTDKSNADTRFLRNRIRHRLMPLLKKEFGPHMTQTLARLADNAAKDFEVSSEGASALLDLVRIEKTPGRLRLNRRALAALPGNLFHTVLEAALRELGATRLSARHFDMLRTLVEKGAGASGQLPGKLTACAMAETLDINASGPAETTQPKLPTFTIEYVPCQGKPSFPPEDAPMAYVDAGKLAGKICVRFRKNGDRFFPLGAPGEMKLQDFLVNRKIPREKRDPLPLFTCLDRIFWIPGLRIAEDFKVTDNTRKIAIIKVAN